MKRSVVSLGLAAAVTSLVATGLSTVVPATAQGAPLPPGASTGRCDKLPRPDERRSVGAEVQMRLNAQGAFLIVDGIVGPKTVAALNAWARKARYPARARWTPDQVKAALFRMRSTKASYTVIVDKTKQRVRIRRNGFLAADLKTSTGHGQWYRGTRRDGSQYVSRALTPSGLYKAGRRKPGWYESPLGCLYDPVFLDRYIGNGRYQMTGIALHGSMLVTGSPASSGCVRLDPAVAAATQRLLQSGAKVRIQGPDEAARNRSGSV